MEQECLKDYIKLSQNIKTPKNVQSKVESIIITTEKKKECEDRAIAIVELLLEGSVRPETFLKSILYLNSTYYQDIVEERAITNICGYPLCGKKVKAGLNKRYSISTKNNKVYDLDEYGYFCSVFCFNASNHVKNQIGDSPLWLRDFQNIPAFSLLQKNEGHFGQGVNLKSKILSVGNEDFVPVVSFAEISLDDFIQSEDRVKNETKPFTLQTIVETKKPCGSENDPDLKNAKHKLETIIEDSVEDNMKTILANDKKKEKINEEQNKTISFNDNSEKNFKKSENSGDLEKSVVTRKIRNIDSEECRTAMEQENGNVVQITFAESLKRNETKCNEDSISYFSDRHLKVERNLTIPSTNLKISDSIKKNDGLLKKQLNLKDLNEKIKRKFTKPIVKLIDPLPLKSETSVAEKSIEQKNINETSKGFVLENRSLLKLKFPQNSLEIENQIRNFVRKWISLDTLMFIHGENRIREILNEKKMTEYFDKLKIAQLEVSQQQKYIGICKRLQLQEILEQKRDSEFTNSTNLQPLPDFTDLKKEKQNLDIKVKHFLGGMLYEADDTNFPMKETKEKEEEGVPAVLPLVDVNSQNTLRRRVLLATLNKSVKFFLEIVKFHFVSLFTDLQDLVKTFRLSADTVIFKPTVSNYLGFICLKIIAVKDAQLRDLLRTREAIEYENLILDSLPGKNEVISSCLSLIENVDMFIENYVVSEM